jgi:cytochrome c oxidase cbb3-type subunit III
MSAKHDHEAEPVVHEYDGIQECDNSLPNWWLATFAATIVFGGLYWFHYEAFHFGESPNEVYQAELDQRAAAEAERIKKAGAITPEALVSLSKDKGTVATGQDIFKKNCVQCHRDDGGGNVGPNLTDNAWLHGSAPDAIFKTVSLGVPAKGMQPWQPQLGVERTMAVVAYVLTLKNTNVPGGKAPQGTVE